LVRLADPVASVALGALDAECPLGGLILSMLVVGGRRGARWRSILFRE
jgi:hypothetical protein